MNPWPTITLSDYERHMALPSVGQASMLARELATAVAEFNPKSLVLVGCAGGNGLEALIQQPLSRIVCIDINPTYVAELKKRYQARFSQLECYVSEIERFSIEGEVDFVFGGLVFEYTRLNEALDSIRTMLRRGGRFTALVQMPSPHLPKVSPSPYADALAPITTFFQYRAPDEFITAAQQEKLNLSNRRLITLESGKTFTAMCFNKET